MTESQARVTAPEPDGAGIETASQDPAAGTSAPGEPGSLAARARTAVGAVRRQAVTLLVAAAILIAFAVWAAVHARSLRADGADQNLALTDKAETAQVTGQIRKAVATVFSYSYADPDVTRAAAQRLLTGPAVRQYDSLFALVEKDAPAQKLVLATSVTSIGVELLTPATARLLIFVNQQDAKGGTGAADYSGAMLAVTAVLRNGHWLIEDMDTFTSPTS
jgi:Mce-associated membrane protein